MPDDAKLGSEDRQKSPLMKPTIRPLQSLYNALKSLPFQLFNHPIFRTTTRKPHTKTPFESLPNEILLEIFSHLELKPYIISHGVCKKWRQLLPLTKLHPIRQRLLNLYHRILETPDFERTQEWTSQHLLPFDREEYIRCLLQQYSDIPEEFRMWILEWPARIVVQSTWPGLPFVNCRSRTPIVRRYGVSWIAQRPFSPKLSSLVYRYRDPCQAFVPALLIWRYSTNTDWLIFGHEGPDLFGRVLRTLAEFHGPGALPYYPKRTTMDNSDNNNSEDSDAESVISEGEKCLLTFDDWIHYLEFLWGQTIDELQDPSENFPSCDLLIPQPVGCIFFDTDSDRLPAPAWDSCQRATVVW